MRYVALLRAVNVGGRKVTMKELREAAEQAGLENCRTLIASGNLVFDTRKATDARIASELEAVINKTFGLHSEVMVRNPAEWSAILKANPFPKKARDDPAHLVCVVCRDKPDTKAIDAYLVKFRENHDRGEQLKIVGREIYIDFGDSIGRSKLILPKNSAIGTARNWNTMLKLNEMLKD
jgi:uncharacterized protein (DUF1697 family)